MTAREGGRGEGGREGEGEGGREGGRKGGRGGERGGGRERGREGEGEGGREGGRRDRSVKHYSLTLIQSTHLFAVMFHVHFKRVDLHTATCKVLCGQV